MKKTAPKLTPSKPLPSPQPIFYNLTQTSNQSKLEELTSKKNPHIIDTYETQLKELFTLENPALYQDKPELAKQFKNYRQNHYGPKNPEQAGLWVYLPWRNYLLHLLKDEKYQQVRTGRNRNLITPAEQKKFYHSSIGIAGLSVGNSVALSIVLTGGGKRLKLADPDTLELTNLNRIRSSIVELTEPKVYAAARQIYELDPYAELELYTDGITEENIANFFTGLDLVIDEIDHLPLKLKMRDQAKNHKIPLLMATDNGDSGLLDIERHDLEPDIPYFHGRLTDEDIKTIFSGKLTVPQIGTLIGEKLVGFDITEQRMLDSLQVIGKEIPTWPQLGTAALLNGAAIAAAARKILTNQPITNQRAILSLSNWLQA